MALEESIKITNTNHKNLDGLRAIGILLVIYTHYFEYLFNISFGWISLELLFCISGFLITGILLETLEDKHYFKKFYTRRLLRIFPAYYLLLFLFFVFILIWEKGNPNFDFYLHNFHYYLLYFQNWLYIFKGFPLENHLAHTWSLAVDEQIYIFWPLLIFILKKPKKILILTITTILFCFIFRFVYVSIETSSPHPCPYFNNTFCRLDSFALGSLLIVLLKYYPKCLNVHLIKIIAASSIIIFLLIGFSNGSFQHTGFYMKRFGFTIAGVFSSCILFYAITQKSKKLNILFSQSQLVYIGKISYSLYLYHWFVLILLQPKIQQLIMRFTFTNAYLYSVLVCLFITFIASILSFTYFEKPFAKLKNRFKY